MKPNRLWWAMLLASQTIFLNGCTSVLWDPNTFAHSYEPAKPVNLRLFYSDRKRDVLVEYDEGRDGAAPIRQRRYYADQNVEQVNNHRRPHFTCVPDQQELHQIPITNGLTSAASPSFQSLYAASPSDGDSFSLYSKGEVLDSYILPRYVGTSRRFKQVLLTPFAVAIDITIVGAIATLTWGPYALSGLSGKTL